ncbi:MAG: cysteine synthase A [Clostridia bacterium]|nr:cysteine synthase A [Clostridia bacterium]
MAKIFNGVDEMIGKTPLVRLNSIERDWDLNCRLLAKVERSNPAGSVKDRVALYMINNAIKEGKINKDTVIIEPTSGNTGIGICMLCAAKNLQAIIVMPDTMSVERRKLMSAYGAEVVLTDGKKGMKGAIEKANELNKEIKNSFVCGQFDNTDNVKAHFETTGPEIFEDTDGEVDIFVSAIGTGGTISGVGEYLKSKKKDVKIVGVEPSASPVLTKGESGSHKIQGIGAGFVPSIYKADLVDKVIMVDDEEAYSFARLCATQEGLLVGISSGAALCAAVKQAKLKENKGKTIVVLLADTGERYLSSDLF